jgi:hypothetical protein
LRYVLLLVVFLLTDPCVKILESVITYIVFTFICRHATLAGRTESAIEDLNRWIDCWADCANVLVAKGKRVCVIQCAGQLADTHPRTGGITSTMEGQFGTSRAMLLGKATSACASSGMP